MFVEKYVHAVNSSDLRDDEHHSATHALTAAALADMTGSATVLGSLLCRAKYADGATHKTFELGTKNLAQLLAAWKVVVRAKGTERKWADHEERMGHQRRAQALRAGRGVVAAALAQRELRDLQRCQGNEGSQGVRALQWLG
jgi:hypothetical protein